MSSESGLRTEFARIAQRTPQSPPAKSFTWMFCEYPYRARERLTSGSFRKSRSFSSASLRSSHRTMSSSPVAGLDQVSLIHWQGDSAEQLVNHDSLIRVS